MCELLHSLITSCLLRLDPIRLGVAGCAIPLLYAEDRVQSSFTHHLQACGLLMYPTSTSTCLTYAGQISQPSSRLLACLLLWCNLSSSGEHQWLGVQALADGGRFLEVGKVGMI